MAIKHMSNEEATKRLQAQGAGRGLFSSPPPPMNGESFTAMMLSAAAHVDAIAPARRKAGPPAWFKPMLAVMVPAFFATAAFALYSPTPTALARARVHSTHELTRRGVYVELDDSDDLEFYGPNGASAGRATTDKAAAARAKANAKLELGGLSYGATHEPLVTPAQASAAKREASFIDLTRNVRRGCRSAADAFPTSVQARAHIVVGKRGSASEVSVTGNAPAVAACIEREARAYKFPPEAVLSTIEVPFSWRKQ